MEDLKTYYKELRDEGYIKEDGTPLKCQHCDNKSFVYQNEIYENSSVVEYTLTCDKCYAWVGHWAYGNWQLR